MKLVWCPDTASKAYIDGVRAIAADNNDSAAADGSPELAELLAAMAGGWNAQLIVDAPASSAPSPSLPSSSSSSSRPPATSLALAAAARRTGGRYARLDADEGPPDPDEDNHFGSGYGTGTGTEAAMARLEGVDLLVLDAGRHDAAAVLGAARPGPRGMVVVVRHGGTGGVRVRRRASAAPPWGTMAAGTRVVRAAFLPIGAGGVEVLHVGVGEGPGLRTTTTTTTQQLLLHGGHGRRSAGRGRRWIRHVNHRTGEEHVFRRQ